MIGEHFAVRNMQRDPWSEEMVTVTIDYSFPLGWPVNDIDIDGLRVAAVDCRGPLGTRTFGVLDNPANTLNPSFNAIIGKVPTTAIQLSFFQDVVQSNCLFQMRVRILKIMRIVILHQKCLGHFFDYPLQYNDHL